MTCPVMKDLLEATPATERHVAECPGCRKALAEQKSLMALLDVFEAPAVSADFNRRLWKRLDAAPAAGFFGLVRGWLMPAIPLVAAVALVVAGFTYDHRVVPTHAPVSVSEAEKVERTLDDIQLLSQFEKGQEGDPAV